MSNLPSYSKILSDHIIKPYDTIVDVYSKKHFGELIFVPLLEKFATLLPRQATVLDAGCGPGGESQFLLKQDFKVIGIDISSKMVEKAKEMNPRGKFIEMDLAKLKFSHEYFNGIWSARTLIHIPSSIFDSVLQELHRVLKPNGVVCLTVLMGGKEVIEPEYYDSTNSTTTFFHFFRPGELENNLKNAGFTVTDVQRTYLGEEKEEHYTVFANKGF